jgi:two-component system, chemotaxis family, response regulator Rcp1
MSSGPINILLVEDNPGDARLTQEAFKEGRFLNKIEWVKDGEEAMDFLNKKGRHKNAPTPEIILLDLNLPKKDGREVLAEIKDSDKIKHIPVIVMTTSKDHEDLIKTYDLQANCFIQKPVGTDQFIKVVKDLQNFWFEIVILPKKGD